MQEWPWWRRRPQVAPCRLARKLRKKDQFVDKEVFQGQVTLEWPCGRSAAGGLWQRLMGSSVAPPGPAHSRGRATPALRCPAAPPPCGFGPGPRTALWRSPQAAPGLRAPRGGLAWGRLPDWPSPWPVPPTVLLDEIEAAELEGNDDRLEGVLCGAVRQLKVTRAKPDSVLYLSLMYLAKMKPNIFATEGVIEVRATVPSSVPGSGEGRAEPARPPCHRTVSRRPYAASCGGTPPSTSRPRATAWCLCWPATSSWPRTRRTRTGPRSLSR